MDYSKLRSQAIDSGQEEEAVTVNTRALIDKVLARYSGEWTTLRELIQNAADANATKVSIKFETSPSASVPLPQSSDDSSLLKHTVLNHHLHRLVVSNNGTPFNENDWARLKRIAEGNPDETKIGAFGVGFYSVFSECENPLVSSGNESMAFFWKGNSLFTRRGAVPESMRTGETAFVLDYREATSPIPNLMSICQFLSSSLTFVGLETLELWLDNWNVFTLRKKSAPASPIPIPKNIDTRTHEGLMKVSNVASQNAQIDASWTNIVGWTPTRQVKSTQPEPEQKSGSLRMFFSRLTAAAPNSAAKKAAEEEEKTQHAIAEDLSGKSSATVFIRISTVNVATSVSSSFATELERATKKPPPKQTRIAILTSSHDETEATMSTLSGTGSSKVAKVILSALPSRNGRVYIGFPTAQTTGVLAHISAPSLIPTVERENIDLNARYVRNWNEELLRAAGIACRIAYSGEMMSVRDRLQASAKSNNGNPSESDIQKAMPNAIHILKQFTFRESTPLEKVGALIEEAFWTCNYRKSSIDLLSSVGVLSSDQVRIASEKLSFVKGLPVVPAQIMKEAGDFMKKLADYGLISDIQIGDIKKELEKQALTEEQLEEFLKWLAPKAMSKDVDQPSIQSLFSATVVNMKEENLKHGQSAILELRSIATFVNVARMPPTMPFPATTMPFRFTKNISAPELQAMTWIELQTVPWITWLVESANANRISAEINITRAPEFAAQTLVVLSKSWDQLSQSSKSTVTDLLARNTVMPTKAGMRIPSDSYFASVQLFDDLPTVQGLDGVKEKLLKALGVRKTIELSVIFKRLMQTDVEGKGSTWNHVDLIKYLVSVWGDIPDSDIAQLRMKSICPAEVAGDSRQGTKERYKLVELYEPTPALRSLQLPVLQWPGQWNAYSSDGKFLRLLGLQLAPSVDDLVQIMAKAHANMDVATYEASLRYFLENHYQQGYSKVDLSRINVAFVPISSTEKRQVALPRECFADSDAKVLGFSVLREDLRDHAGKLGVAQNPPIKDCALRLLRNPPENEKAAKPVFEYFAKRVADINAPIADTLGAACIVPITKLSEKTGKASTRHTTPRACFMGDDDEYSNIFDYVDFGETANRFLNRCGSKPEPSTAELTRLLVREPAHILATLQEDKYLGLLRKIQINMPSLKKDKELWREMKRMPFLLAYTERPSKPAEEKSSAPQNLMDDDLEETEIETTVREWHLRSAQDIVVLDDLISYNHFRKYFFSAPQEETLEDLYLALGAEYVSQRVEEEPKVGPRIGDQHKAIQLQSLLLERVRLFLHEQPQASIDHDVKWLEKNLDVQTVQSVSLIRRLKSTGHTSMEKRTAAIVQSSTTRGKFVLCITKDYEAWQVSQEVASLIMKRPKTQTIMLLEMFMTLSLVRLRARGYNVDRVLKRKQAEEARNKELDRQRRKEEEQKRAEEAAAKQEKQALVPTTPSVKVNGDAEAYHDEDDDAGRHSMDKTTMMPGSFNDSPRPRRPSSSRHRPRNFLNSITRHLGLSDHAPNDAMESMRNFLGGGGGSNNGAVSGSHPPPPVSGPPEPPPYTPYDTTGTTSGGRISNPEAVTSQTSVQENLKRAVGASRAFGSNTLFSRPSTVNVKETPSYCDARPGHDQQFLYTTAAGIKVYLESSLAADSAAFMSRNSTSLELFGTLVASTGALFNLRTDTLHIFYNETGSTIAFNTGGSVFCNFRFFAQLHHAGLSASDPQSRAQSYVAALTYWWVVLCHELAHNLVQDHSSEHSYYTEQFVVQYFPVVLASIVSGEGYRAMFGGSGPAGESRRLTGVEQAFS